MDPGIADGLGGPWMLAWLAVLVVLDGFIPPVPSEIALVAAGSFAEEGRVSALALVLVGTLGSLAADLGVYLLFRYRMADVLDRTRWGRQAHRTIRRVVERFGTSTTYGAIIGVRFLAGGRLTASATAGVGEVPIRRFAGAAGIGGFLWAAWHVALGYVTGQATSLPFWASTAVGASVGLVVGLVVAVAAATRHRRRHAASPGAGSAEAGPAEPPSPAGPAAPS
ncbi:DedA family protein [Sinomonas halotolerans]|uniref:VTT domain-containing protein n=1 Tax=Sinomonas halotolerans TaxID=1644133 RepID=A0ABU9X3Z8_9MICC